MKALYMLIGTLLLMAAFAVASYSFTQTQLLSMQEKIDSSWAHLENLQQKENQKDSNIKSKISVASTQYNRLVENYNASIKRFPGSYIAEEYNMQPRILIQNKEAPSPQ